MAADTVLVIDAGTSTMRALAVRANGGVTMLAQEPWPVFIPDDAAPFGREFAVAAVQSAFGRLIASAAPHQDIVAAVAVTAQREGITFLDTDGEALFASPNVDARASAEGMAIDSAHGADVYAVTGHSPSLMQAPAKLAWLRTHRPEVAARIARVLPLGDWLAMLLTGKPTMSRSLAAENGLVDVATGAVPKGLLARLGLSSDLLPPVMADGSITGGCVAGPLSGLPVVLAGADTQCALAGMGAIEAGSAGLVAGWSGALQLVTSSAVFDSERRTWTGVHVAPGRWILESNTGEMGRAFDWICAMMKIDPAAATQLAAEAPPGSADALSVLGPRVMRASAMNVGVGGITLPLPLVMSAPDRGQVLRSVLEAAAYAARANLEQLEQVSGVRIDALAIGGGMSRSAAFTQIVADVIDRPVHVATAPETSAVGAAALAAVAVGLHTTLADAVGALTAGGGTLAPNARTSAAYEDYYDRWCATSDAFERMAGV